MKMIYSIIWLMISFSQTEVATAQPLMSSDYYGSIKNYDAGKLWYTNIDEKSVEATIAPEPLGFIGPAYQRFYIHYLTVTKDKLNPYQYRVTGKTKVKDIVCCFNGTITIVKAGIFKKQFDYRYKQGFIECRIDLYEDSTTTGSGFFSGRLVSKFYLDEKGKLQYDDLLFGADGYFNNQCEASWTSYRTHTSKRVNWGDYRIPASKELDIGDGEFAVNNKYIANGWQNYKTAWSGDREEAATKHAQQIEEKHWWEKL